MAVAPERYRRRRWGVRRRWLVLEAALQIGCVRAALAVCPFPWLIWWFTRPVRHPEVEGEARRQITRDVVWALWTAKAKLGVHFVCFSGSLAAKLMLHRRGIGTTLYYGAATHSDHGGFNAHVWLQDGAEGVIFHQTAAAYHVLATYAPGQRA